MKIDTTTAAVDHLAADHCRMTFAISGGAAELNVLGPEHRLQRAAPSMELELRSQGFVPLGDTISVRSQRGPESTMRVVVDRPDRHYVMALTTGAAGTTWHLPEPDLVIANSPGASAFTRVRGAQPTARVQFRIPIPAGRRGPRTAKAQSLVGRVIRFFKVKISEAVEKLRSVPDLLAEKLATYVDKKLLRAPEGLKVVDPELSLRKASKSQLRRMRGQPVLLLVHGIFSRIGDAFRHTVEGENPPLEVLIDRYEGRVLGYDHWTVSKSTLRNARELAADLPERASLNILCHSRGGGVVRCLLEHPEVASVLDAKGVKVTNVVFIAGACLGSPLARPETVDRLINCVNLVTSLAGLGTMQVKVVAYLFKLLLHGVQELPGIEAMNPDAAIFETLAKAKATLAERYIYYRANFDPGNLVARGADELLVDLLAFEGAPNDAVVPFYGAGTTKQYLSGGEVKKKNAKSFGSAQEATTRVFHNNFFQQDEVRAGLLRYL